MSAQGTSLSSRGREYQPILKTLEKAVAGSAVVAALMYALGLFVENFHLMAFGVSDFSSFRPKYMLTGAWSFMLIMSSSLPTVLCYLAVRRTGGRSYAERIPQFVLAFVIGVMLAIYWNVLFLFVIVRLPLLDTLLKSLIQQLSTAFVGFLLWVGVAAVRYLAKLLENYYVPPNMLVVAKVGLWGIVAWLVLGLILTQCVMFSNLIFPQIPEGLGGGSLSKAVLILNRDGIAVWNEAGTVIQPSGDLAATEPVEMIYQNEHEVVVIKQLSDTGDEGQRIITLNKDVVKGMIRKMREREVYFHFLHGRSSDDRPPYALKRIPPVGN
jgi:hypothetical protein